MKVKNKLSVAMITTDLSMNGISTVIINYCANIDLNKYKIIVIAGDPISEVCEEKANRLGITVKKFPSRRTSTLKFYVKLFGELFYGKYDIVHIHGNSATVVDELLIAWLCRIPVRIVHSHNSTCTHMGAHKIMLPLFNCLYTQGFACGDLAGKWLFGDRKFYVLPNGFNTERFCFDTQKRTLERKYLGVEDKFLIGNVARFNDQKNHPFLLKIFEKLAEIRTDAYLVLVGDGPDFEKIRVTIHEHPYKERIIIYGVTNETEKVYDAMDVFVLPSKYEGLAIALLEAQISGLPCIASDVVSRETKIGENLSFLSLDDSVEKWVQEMLQATVTNESRALFYEGHKNKIEEFDIKKNADMLGKYYERFCGK